MRVGRDIVNTLSARCQERQQRYGTLYLITELHWLEPKGSSQCCEPESLGTDATTKLQTTVRKENPNEEIDCSATEYIERTKQYRNFYDVKTYEHLTQ